MSKHTDLMAKLEDYDHTYHKMQAILKAYRTFKEADVLVLEACKQPEGPVYFLNHLEPYVVFRGKCYRLPEAGDE